MDKFQPYIQKAQTYLTDFYAKQGNKGVAKIAAVGFLTLLLQYQIRKHNGWLNKKNVTGQHIFITGGASGIGKQMAISFAKQGALITIVDINENALKLAVTEIQGLVNGAKIIGIQCDVSNPISVKTAASQSLDFHKKSVDILINNAGIVSGKQILQNTEDNIQRTINVNTTAHHWTVRQFLPQMLENNYGHIVTIASIAGWSGVRGLADYCASKFGAVGFDESLRFELRALKKNVKTTCICPYFINTGMFDGAKSKFPLLLPILSESYASKRIVNAIRQEEAVVIMPVVLNLAIVSKAIFPTCVYDWFMDFFGVSESMDHFKGRQV